MLSDLFRDIITRYQDRAEGAFAKDAFVAQITDDLPVLLKARTQTYGDLKIKGSAGVGNWAETPWIALLDPQITTTTQEGYYVCYLIDPKKQTMHLCLAVGWTQFAERYSTADAKKRIADYSRYLLSQLPNSPSDFNTGPIDLSAKGDLSKGYEQGQILYKRYELADLADDTLDRDLNAMLRLSVQLKQLVGGDIQNIDYEKVVTGTRIDEVEKTANALTLEDDLEQIQRNLRQLSSTLPPARVERIIKKVVRNRKIAELIKKRNQYICEICQRQPFTQKNGKPYAEADHITPLGDATGGLDTPENMRCLCPQCHAIVTYGSDEEIRRILTR